MFTEFLEWWSDKCVRTNGAEPAPRTLEAKGYRLRAVAKMLGADSPMSFAAQVGDRERVLQLIDMLYTRQQPNTIISTVVALKHFGEYALAKGWISQVCVYTEDVPQRASRKRPIEVYSAAELEKLLLYARVKDLRLWMFLSTLVDTGRRVSEVLGLRWEDFRFDAEPPHIDLGTTKNKKQQYIPMTSNMVTEVYSADHIQALKTKGHPLWKKDIREWPFPWKYQAVHGQLRDVCESAEVPFHHGLHVFRHTYATTKLAKGVPVQAVSSLLGHSSVGITDRIYNHTNALSYTQYVD